MDVAGVRPDELGPAEPRRARSWSGWTTVQVVAGIVLVALAALLVVLAQRVSDRQRRTDARDAATLVARQEAVNLTTLDYRHAGRDLERILTLATGDLRSRFAAQRAQFPRVLGQQQSRSVGTVLAAGIVRLSEDRRAAQVVVAADATVSTGKQGSGGQSALKHYRMVMQLRVVGGQWRVSDLAFAGVPQ